MKTRECYRCKKVKNFSQFNKDRTQVGGISYDCKECKSKFRKRRRLENPEHYKLQQSKNLEKNFDNIRKSQKEHYENNKEKINKKRRKYRKLAERTVQDKARTMMHHAIRLGYLTRPKNCEVCLKECKPDGHHDDYSKPLEVNWLCKICHYHRHGKLLYLKKE